MVCIAPAGSAQSTTVKITAGRGLRQETTLLDPAPASPQFSQTGIARPQPVMSRATGAQGKPIDGENIQR